MNYFKDCQTLEQAKKLARKLYMKLHPDTSGYDSQSDFIKMRAQFEAFKPSVKKEADKDFNFAKFENIILQFNKLSNVEINFVGSWIYILDAKDFTGSTFAQKEIIKTIILDGFEPVRFSRSKKAWYYMPKGTKVFKKRGKSLDSLKYKYGVHTFETEKVKQLNK